MRQNCPLSPLLFLNLYLCELGLKIEGRPESFKYTAVNSNGELRRRNLAGLMYADDVCGKCRVFTMNL